MSDDSQLYEVQPVEQKKDVLKKFQLKPRDPKDIFVPVGKVDPEMMKQLVHKKSSMYQKKVFEYDLAFTYNLIDKSAVYDVYSVDLDNFLTVSDKISKEEQYQIFNNVFRKILELQLSRYQWNEEDNGVNLNLHNVSYGSLHYFSKKIWII